MYIYIIVCYISVLLFIFHSECVLFKTFTTEKLVCDFCPHFCCCFQRSVKGYGYVLQACLHSCILFC